MYKIIITVVVIALIGIAAVFFLFNQNPSQSTLYPTPSQNISSKDTSQIDLGQGGSSYLDEKGIYSILYPNDYILDTQDPEHIRIYKRGKTQRPQSEMSDGVLMVFESIDLKGKSLESFVNSRIKEATADGTSKIIENKKAVTQNTYPGFRYVLRGLGESQNLVLQKDTNSNNAVVITYSIMNPEQKDYQKEIDAVLSSLKLLK